MISDLSYACSSAVVVCVGDAQGGDETSEGVLNGCELVLRVRIAVHDARATLVKSAYENILRSLVG